MLLGWSCGLEGAVEEFFETVANLQPSIVRSNGSSECKTELEERRFSSNLRWRPDRMARAIHSSPRNFEFSKYGASILPKLILSSMVRSYGSSEREKKREKWIV